MRNAWMNVALLSLSCLAMGSTSARDRVADTGASIASAEASRQVFARLKALSGEWRGKSTKGWTDRLTMRVIAGGSVLVEMSDFEAHPDETMMTAYHLDGDSLLLTHYCVAQNQPRLQLSSLRDGGQVVTFTFRDATNLTSRNQGHMDRVVFDFQDEDHFSSQWSFYRDGKEDWMEEIHYERLR